MWLFFFFLISKPVFAQDNQIGNISSTSQQGNVVTFNCGTPKVRVYVLAPDQNSQSFEANQKIAWDFVVNSPTYKFDGFGIKIENSKELDCSSCWQFDFSFSCRHSGYGNREGKIPAQIITGHQIVVQLENSKVVKAIIDNRWDEINQNLLLK